MAYNGAFGFHTTILANTGLTFQGTWDANANNPFLQSGVGVGGEYYIVSVPGNTNLDGVNIWQVGDWAIFESTTNMWQKISNSVISAYSFIQEEGVNLPQQNIIDFQGAGATASAGIGKTIVTIPIQPAYAIVQDEGIALPQENTLDFQGFGVTATAGINKTIVTIPSVTIEDEGIALPQRQIIDFQGFGVTATAGINKTIVTIPSVTIEDEGIALPQRQIIDFQGLGVQAQDIGGKTVVTVVQGLPATNYGLYSQTANSPLITGTIVQSTLIGTGVGTLSVPANGFFVGASFRADLGGVINTANNQTIRIRVKTAAGVIFLDSGVQNISGSISNGIWTLTINFTIRQIGGVNVASIVTLSRFTYAKTVNGTIEGFAFNTVNSTTFDTTILNTLEVTAQFGSNNAGNSMYSDIFVLNKIY